MSRSLSRLTDSAAVIAAMELCQRMGDEDFLAHYGFGRSHRYHLVHGGRTYDSKAIAGVAFGLQHSDLGPLTSADFSGGVGPTGAATVLRRLGFEVVGGESPARAPGRTKDSRPQPILPTAEGWPHLLLLGCVKGKRPHPAPAADLYCSALWDRRRRYAEGSGLEWRILSAQHGLVDPGQILEPYDLAMKDQSVTYRREWGAKVVEDLMATCNLKSGAVVEVHAGAAYVDAIQDELARRGVSLLVPLKGLTQGQHLAWYNSRERLGWIADAHPAALFPWGRSDLESSGLYAWWVDEEGAADLSTGLRHALEPGLIYIGQAGATSTRSGRVSGATLRSRIGGQHLRGAVTASTWRQTLAAALCDVLGLGGGGGDLDRESHALLNEWMSEHLSIAVLSVHDVGTIHRLEAQLIAEHDPPLNLSGSRPTAMRQALTARRRELRRRVSG